MIKTYDVKNGTVLILPDGKKTMLFATEEEAVEYIRELEKKDEDPDE